MEPLSTGDLAASLNEVLNLVDLPLVVQTKDGFFHVTGVLLEANDTRNLPMHSKRIVLEVGEYPVR